MAWATMHFATGMCCGAVVATTACAVLRRGWRWIPLAMTAGGLWAMIPDSPRLFREDFPNAPLAAWLGSKPVDAWLNRWGDVFCFHRALDNQPHEYALAGLAIILLLYNMAILGLMTWRRESVDRRLQLTQSQDAPTAVWQDPMNVSRQPSLNLAQHGEDGDCPSIPPRRRAS